MTRICTAWIIGVVVISLTFPSYARTPGTSRIYSDRDIMNAACGIYKDLDISEGNNSFAALSKRSDSPENWRIINVFDDRGTGGSGLYACTIDDGNGNCIISYRGTEGFKDGPVESINNIAQDWILAYSGLTNSGETTEQHAAERYTHYIFDETGDDFKWFTLVGHSLGGNLAEHSAITAPDKMKEKCSAVSLDGPGFSEVYLDERKDEIDKLDGKLFRRSWTVVGGLLNCPSTEEVMFIDVPSGKHTDYDGPVYDKNDNFTPGDSDIGEMITFGVTSLLDGGIRIFSDIVSIPKWLMNGGKNIAVKLGKDPKESSVWSVGTKKKDDNNEKLAAEEPEESEPGENSNEAANRKALAEYRTALLDGSWNSSGVPASSFCLLDIDQNGVYEMAVESSYGWKNAGSYSAKWEDLEGSILYYDDNNRLGKFEYGYLVTLDSADYHNGRLLFTRVRGKAIQTVLEFSQKEGFRELASWFSPYLDEKTEEEYSELYLSGMNTVVFVEANETNINTYLEGDGHPTSGNGYLSAAKNIIWENDDSESDPEGYGAVGLRVSWDPVPFAEGYEYGFSMLAEHIHNIKEGKCTIEHESIFFQDYADFLFQVRAYRKAPNGETVYGPWTENVLKEDEVDRITSARP